jgi:small subunit ribosomal protein S21
VDIQAGPLMMEGRDPRERRSSNTAGRIDVIGNQIEPALKALKKQMLKDGTFQEMKRRAFYEKPSVKRKRKQAQARKKRRRALKRSRVDDEE